MLLFLRRICRLTFQDTLNGSTLTFLRHAQPDKTVNVWVGRAATVPSDSELPFLEGGNGPHQSPRDGSTSDVTPAGGSVDPRHQWQRCSWLCIRHTLTDPPVTRNGRVVRGTAMEVAFPIVEVMACP